MSGWAKRSAIIYWSSIVAYLLGIAFCSPSHSTAIVLRSPVFWLYSVLLTVAPAVVAAVVCFPFWVLPRDTSRLFFRSLTTVNLVLAIAAFGLAGLYWTASSLQTTSDFRPVSLPIASPNSSLQLVPMVNKSYTDDDDRMLVTFDVRNKDDEFVHHVQSNAPGDQPWALGWHNDNMVVLMSDATGVQAWIVGAGAIVYELPQPVSDEVMATGRRLREERRSQGSMSSDN